jgi:hypothetical protein
VAAITVLLRVFVASPRRRGASSLARTSWALERILFFAWQARGRQWQNAFTPLQEDRMATVLFVVKATIRKDQEEAFNRWYNEEHVPQVLQWKGVVSARRYRAILGEDTYQYMAMYELVNEENFRALMDSEHMKALRAEYDAHFGGVSERARFAYEQVWP